MSVGFCITSAVPDHEKPSWSRALRIALIWAIVWLAPIALFSIWLGNDHTVVREGLFFSKAALITFAGAYAVLPYVAQQAVETHHWLTAVQMLDGLGLAETTPGPLIMVTQFVGFLDGWNYPGKLSLLLAASLGAFAASDSAQEESQRMKLLRIPSSKKLVSALRTGTCY